MANRLQHETSPYLLQHASNPVDWYSWGPKPLALARAQNKPILVSIGYSACHWCHVMERESFEDEETARLMNEHFINIKVDREERPDVDAIYMEAVQALTGHGGWPLNVFLTSDGRPFYGGTYFPPAPRHGLPSWRQVLESIATTYRDQPATVAQNADLLTDYVRRAQNLAPSDLELRPQMLRSAYDLLSAGWDVHNGGFGAAPKFPQPLALDLALRLSTKFEDERGRSLLFLTLRKMAAGGIYDHLGGGFHRYSVDEQWLVPHFEKMLYDNALLALTFLDGYLVSADPTFLRVVEETLDYLVRDMHAPGGGFYSAQDADSEGVEGKYYVWTAEEVAAILPPDEARVALTWYGITPGGNFEGATILTTAADLPDLSAALHIGPDHLARVLAAVRTKLLDARSRRVPPGIDTKILAGWNALAARAFARAGRALGRGDYLDVARDTVRFILRDMSPGGRLVRSYRHRPGEVPAFLEDHAYLMEALIALYEATFEPEWLRAAQDRVVALRDLFADGEEGAFFDTPPGLEEPVARPRSFFDNPIPSGNAAASFALLRLAALTGNEDYTDLAVPGLRAAAPLAVRAPHGFAYMLSALDFYLSPVAQVAISGSLADSRTQELIAAVAHRYLPNAVVAAGPEGSVPLLESRPGVGGGPAAYVCRHFTCRMPVTEPVALVQEVEAINSA